MASRCRACSSGLCMGQPMRTWGLAPSTRKVLPLMKLAASLSKNTIAAEVLLYGLKIAFAHHQKAAGQVGVDHRYPALGADGFQRRDVLPARVVDQAIDAPLRHHNGRDGGLDGFFLPDVTRVKTHAPAL